MLFFAAAIFTSDPENQKRLTQKIKSFEKIGYLAILIYESLG